MTRIITRNPHPEKEIPVRVNNLNHLDWHTIISAPDFSVPPRDVDIPTRTIAPGLIVLGTPLILSNTTGALVKVDVRVFDEAGNGFRFATNVAIDAYDTALVPVQGQLLVKRDPDSAEGDRLQARADTENAVDVFIACYEREAGQHDPKIGEGAVL